MWRYPESTLVRDLPVGENLQDHYLTLINYRTDTESLKTALSPENLALLQQHGRGPLTSNIGEAGGFFETRDESDQESHSSRHGMRPRASGPRKKGGLQRARLKVAAGVRRLKQRLPPGLTI